MSTAATSALSFLSGFSIAVYSFGDNLRNAILAGEPPSVGNTVSALYNTLGAALGATGYVASQNIALAAKMADLLQAGHSTSQIASAVNGLSALGLGLDIALDLGNIDLKYSNARDETVTYQTLMP